ncbi:MAG TPA: endonuclease/exonuclease/phosphatase family protein [Gemmatimonadales bacterium]|nr:endonuclease/exonuclease/phosphatase family protein [Gemmatimonadales bacterium]
MRAVRSFLAAALLLAAGCAEDGDTPLGPTVEPPADEGVGSAFGLAVMTQNLYVGADVDAVIGALASPDPADDVPALLTAVETLRRTDWGRRASAIADAIARYRPHAVGLQEVSTIDLTIPPLGVDVHLSFLPSLLEELGDRGLTYTAAARVSNFEVSPFPGVTLADEDVLLVDASRVAVHGTTARKFTANVGQVAPGVVLERGWVSASVSVGGKSYTIASTHLEAGSVAGLAQLRALQAGELAQSLAGAGTAIVMGDLNDVPGSPMHQVLAGAGYADLWAELRPGVVGFTCCHLPDLSETVPRFDERIDYVFVRGLGDDLHGQVLRLGEVPADRVAGPDHPIWPSDHAGLMARLGGS